MKKIIYLVTLVLSLSTIVSISGQSSNSQLQATDNLAITIISEAINMTDSINTFGYLKRSGIDFSKDSTMYSAKPDSYGLTTVIQWFPSEEDSSFWIGSFNYFDFTSTPVTWYFKVQNKVITITHISGGNREVLLPQLIFLRKDFESIFLEKPNLKRKTTKI